jgi:protein BCP1
MPHEIVPPMYNMLLEEISWALEEKEPYQFSHYLILSKTYTEVESKLDQEESRPSKKNKKEAQTETFYFHPEDEVLHKHAIGKASFDYTKQGDDGASDAKRTFQELGVRPQAHMMLLENGKFEGAVKAIGEYLAPQK